MPLEVCHYCLETHDGYCPEMRAEWERLATEEWDPPLPDDEYDMDDFRLDVGL